MKTPLQVIAALGIPTNSYIAAIGFLNENADYEKHVFEQYIKDIIGLETTPILPSTFEAKILFRYVIQETIRAYTNTIPIMEEVYVEALRRTKLYLENNPWSKTYFNAENNITNEQNDTDNETKKVDKKSASEKIFKDLVAKNASRTDIINAFVKDIGMSKPGATTYFHALKKLHGFSVKQQQEKVPVSKQELAEKLYLQSADKDKAIIVQQFMEKLGTSKMGAQTYYYAVKKKLENTNDKV